ncbi:hypothetical protein QQS21_000570 [Conoideocrella luteorostrata]|uniref:SMP domain-containing protein n=1 Tax=Conoideocrella luteorostrata TaxID=1105319 RepID=A0AAJ0D0Y2_9HYPO|nr:hypothetical protein QQS21_000570 [Conoideocrella luteorostrata]
MPQNQMTKEDSQRIQSSQATGGRDMSSGGFAARAQAAGDRSQNQSSSGGQAGSNTGNKK